MWKIKFDRSHRQIGWYLCFKQRPCTRVNFKNIQLLRTCHSEKRCKTGKLCISCEWPCFSSISHMTSRFIQRIWETYTLRYRCCSKTTKSCVVTLTSESMRTYLQPSTRTASASFDSLAIIGEFLASKEPSSRNLVWPTTNIVSPFWAQNSLSLM